MALVTDLIRDGQRQRLRPPQQVTQGVLSAPDRGRFQTTVGGVGYAANVGVPLDLRTGDRVWVVLGRGTPKIIGLLGPDQNIPR